MPEVAVALLALGAAVAMFRVPALPALGVLTFVSVLLPATLIVPYLHSGYLTMQHVVVLAGLVRIALAVERPRITLLLTPVHVVLAALLVVSGVVGIALSPDSGFLGFAGFRLADVAEQLGFFVVALALIQQIGDVRRVLAVFGLAVTASCAVALVEHTTGAAYGRWLFANLPAKGRTDASLPLDVRNGQTRARAGAEFALQFGWMTVTLLPALVVAALRHRRGTLLAVGGIVLTSAAVYESFSRTALVSIPVVLVVLALLSRDRRVGTLAGCTAALSVAGYVFVPAIALHVDASADVGSIAVRTQRLGPVMHAVAAHPFRGLGLGELVTSGFDTTDNALLLEYAELGAIGAAVLVILLLTALVQVSRSLGEPDRLAAAACVTGVVVFVVSAMTYDAFTLVQGPHLLWLLVAAGTVLAWQRSSPVALPRPHWLVAAGAGAAALAVGIAVYAVAPQHAARDYFFTTLPATHETVDYDPVTTAATLINTACDLVTSRDRAQRDVSTVCGTTFTAAGMGRLRVEAPSAARVDEAALGMTLFVRSSGVPDFALRATTPTVSGRPSYARTAPLTCPLLVLGLLLVLPWRRRGTGRGDRTDKPSDQGSDQRSDTAARARPKAVPSSRAPATSAPKR